MIKWKGGEYGAYHGHAGSGAESAQRWGSRDGGRVHPGGHYPRLGRVLARPARRQEGDGGYSGRVQVGRGGGRRRLSALLLALLALVSLLALGGSSASAATLVGDTFNQPDGAVSSAWIGSGWSVSNQRAVSSGGIIYQNASADGYVEARWYGGVRSALIFRRLDATHWVGIGADCSGYFSVVKQTGANSNCFDAIVGRGPLTSSGALLRAEFRGETVTAFINGTQFWSGTVSDYVTSTGVGLRAQFYSATWDDFEAGTLTPTCPPARPDQNAWENLSYYDGFDQVMQAVYKASPPAITQGFGISQLEGEPSYHGYPNYHLGVDFAAGYRTPLYAPVAGTVHNYTGGSFGTGQGGPNRVVVLEFTGGDGATYDIHFYHLDQQVVADGSSVAAGDLIAYSDSTGYSTGNHLHMEIRKGGTWGTVVPPEMWLCVTGGGASDVSGDGPAGSSGSNGPSGWNPIGWLWDKIRGLLIPSDSDWAEITAALEPLLNKEPIGTIRDVAGFMGDLKASVSGFGERANAITPDRTLDGDVWHMVSPGVILVYATDTMDDVTSTVQGVDFGGMSVLTLIQKANDFVVFIGVVNYLRARVVFAA